MTKIYIYCLFDRFDKFLGVYSSLKSVHRDALRYTNRGTTRVIIKADGLNYDASLVNLRNIFRGKVDFELMYCNDRQGVKVLKTNLTE
jgi:hypothetical protein